MGQMLGLAIKTARKSKRLTQGQVGMHVGISHAAVGQWESGETTPTHENLVSIGDLLGVDFVAIRSKEITGRAEFNSVGEVVALEQRHPSVNAVRDPSAPSIRKTIFSGGRRKLEVKGQAVCGPRSKADFRFNGQTIGYAQNPQGISDLEDVFVIYVTNDSLEPRYEPGDSVYVDPHRPPAINDYVVIELHGSEDGEPGDGYIKKLIRRTATKIFVLQHNPPDEYSFELKNIKKLSRVIPWKELLGR